MTATPLRLRELLERLVRADVRFVLVGGLAVNAWGYMRATQDIDVVPDPSRENLARLDSHRCARSRPGAWAGAGLTVAGATLSRLDPLAG